MKGKEAKILIIEDQQANLKLLLSVLAEHDYEVRIAENGERALEVLDYYSPDIILLDVMMPGMDGFETCRRIKAAERTADIPIIFMTALDGVKDKVTGFEVGGIDYITKPFQQAEVLARLSTHLTMRRQQLELEEALAEVKKLSGILPICSFCKQIRKDDGYWQQVEEYVSEHSEAMFTHGLCPDCIVEHYGELFPEKAPDK